MGILVMLINSFFIFFTLKTYQLLEKCPNPEGVKGSPFERKNLLRKTKEMSPEKYENGWKLEDVNPGSFEMVPFLLGTFVRFSLVSKNTDGSNCPTVFFHEKLAPKMADQDLGLGEIWGPGSLVMSERV